MQVTRNTFRKYGAKIAAPVTALALLPGFAMAAVDPDVEAAITSAGTDALIVAAAITVVMACLWAALLIKRKFFG